MKIINPSFEIRTPWGLLTEERGIDLLRWIETNARISHRSEDMQTPTSWKRFLQAVVVQRGDWSVAEHATVTVIFRVDRGVTHELVRHRHFSFTQESTRFVNYNKKDKDGNVVHPIEFIRPDTKPLDFGTDGWHDCIAKAEFTYRHMINQGWSPQEARSVLPNALASTISVTGNLRMWRWFFLARTTSETHPDFKRVTIPLLAEFKRLIPILYDDVEPNIKQSISMGKVH